MMIYDPDEEDEGLDLTFSEDDEYCEACMEDPCMCSDPEQTSTTYDW